MDRIIWESILNQNIQMILQGITLLELTPTVLNYTVIILHKDHPYITSAHPTYVSINSTERQKKLPFF